MRTRLPIVFAVLSTLAAPASFAQRTESHHAPADPIGSHFFPPELVMAHQSEIGLQENQRAAITAEIEKAQSKFVALQWRMSQETEHLTKLVEPSVVDEAPVLEQVDRTLAVERDIKRAQIALLIRIKNTLTPAQQAKLAELRDGQP
jgi:Spy/CpxP family protein refolding chaperone